MKSLHSEIKIINAVYCYNGDEIPLLSGEFHYWRVPAENWETAGRRILELGLSVVATYIPWNYHETSEGIYDFTGKTSLQRDLDGFLRLMNRLGLYVIIRPGPYIYAEWRHGGVPERAAVHHRLSPEFLAMSRHYIEAVAEVIAPHQITRNGSIIICQADNEAYPPIESQGEDMGAFGGDGAFKDFLRSRYDNNIERLNSAWNVQYAGFMEACVYFHEVCVDTELRMAERLLPHPNFRQRYVDTFDFIGSYAANIVINVATWLREKGIDIPISANGWSPLYQNFRTMTDAVDICGSDIYPGEYMDKPASTRNTWFYNMDIMKQQEADVNGGNVWSAEFQAGCYPLEVMGYLPPEHFRFITLASFAAGLKGLNYYMLVGRDNWAHSPINEWGQANEFFEPTRQALELARQWKPWQCDITYDIALFCYKPHRVVEPGNFHSCFEELTRTDLTFCYWNPDSGKLPAAETLLYAGADWISPEVAQSLRRFVESGGTLVAFNRFPHTDFSGAPLSCGFAQPDGARPINLPATVSCGEESLVIRDAGHMGRKINLFYFREAPGIPVTAILSGQAQEMLVDLSIARADHFVCGYCREVGKGRLVHLGCGVNADLLKIVLRTLGAELSVTAGTPGVQTALMRSCDGHRYLSAINRNSFIAQPAMRLAKSWCAHGVCNLETGKRTPMVDKELVLPLPAQSVTVYRLE